MSTYPAITAAIADQRRQDLIAQAEAYRLARAARQATPYTSGRLAGARQGRTARPSRPGRPGRPVLTGRRLVTAATAAGCTAAAVFLLGPAAAGHAASDRLIVPAAAAHTSAHRFASPGVHFRAHHLLSSAAPAQHFVRWAAPDGHAPTYRLVRWAAPAPAHHFVSPEVHFRGHVYSHFGRGHVF